MELESIYWIYIWVNFFYIIFPLVGKKRNSIEISTFILSMGWGGYALSKKEDLKSKKITREEYLNKSFKLQSIIFGGNILFLLVCYFSGIEAIIMALIFLVINAMATIAFWLNIKRYKQI